VLEIDPADAVPHYRRALDAFTRLGDRYGQLRCQINIGVACDRAGNNPAAEVSYATALAIGRDIRASNLAAVASLNLGVLLLKTGRFDVAHERFDEARQLFAALWLAAECAGVLGGAGRVAEATLHRYLVHARALGYDPLIAKLRAGGA